MGVTVGQVALLAAIREEPGIGLRDLATRERMSAPAMSGYVDRLEAAGLVVRGPVEGDRRRVGLHLTDSGRRLLRSTRGCAPPGLPTRMRRLIGRAARRPRGRARAARDARPRREARVTAAFRRANRRTFASLRRHRNYRLFFAGQIVSVSGTWMQNIAAAWLVLQLTHSPVAVGILALCQFLPFTVFGLFAGVLVDRLDAHRTVIATQAAALVLAAALAALTLAGHVTALDV